MLGRKSSTPEPTNRRTFLGSMLKTVAAGVGLAVAPAAVARAAMPAACGITCYPATNCERECRESGSSLKYFHCYDGCTRTWSYKCVAHSCTTFCYAAAVAC